MSGICQHYHVLFVLGIFRSLIFYDLLDSFGFFWYKNSNYFGQRECVQLLCVGQCEAMVPIPLPPAPLGCPTLIHQHTFLSSAQRHLSPCASQTMVEAMKDDQNLKHLDQQISFKNHTSKPHPRVVQRHGTMPVSREPLHPATVGSLAPAAFLGSWDQLATQQERKGNRH